jgi:nucleoside-diphosphate-sugar epimerase
MGAPNVIILAALGSRLVKTLLRQDSDQRNMGVRQSASASTWRHAYHPVFPKGVYFVRGDVADADALDAVVQEAHQSWSTSSHNARYDAHVDACALHVG